MFVKSILSAVVAIAACASAVQGANASTKLTSSSFEKAISNGATFVKFYSPECTHSQKLAPTWDQLATQHKDWERTVGFKFAEVDCLKEADLCEDYDVISYPSMKLFYNGKTVTKYNDARTIEALGDFASSYAAEYINVPAHVDLKDVGEVKANPFGKVVVLDNETYDRRTQFGAWMIEYYAPWCGHCKALAPIYEELAQELKGQVNVAKVDCTVNREICHRNRIQGYPTIRLHQFGDSTEYNFARTAAEMAYYARQALVPSLLPLNLDGLQNAKSTRDVSFIYVHDDNTKADITKAIEKQSQLFYQKVELFSSKDAEVAQALSVSSPALVLLKDNNQFNYEGSLTDEVAIKAWINDSKKPLVHTITHNAGSFLSAPGWSAMGLFDPSKPTTAAARHEMIELAKKYMDTLSERTPVDGKPLRFGILDATKWESYVRGAFKMEPSQLPAVIVVNSREEIFYPFGLDGRVVPVEQEALLTYIAQIENGELKARSMLSPIQKGFRYGQARFQVAMKFAYLHPMISMFTVGAIVLALMRRLAAALPTEEEMAAEAAKKEN